MRLLLLLGWRNLRRRKWRSWLTGLMFFIGAGLLVFMVGLAEGAYAEMISLGTRVYHGDFQILSGDYARKPSLFKKIEDYREIAARLEADELVTGVCYRIETAGLLSRESNTVGALVVGFDPAREVASFPKALAEGRWWPLDSEQTPIVLGKGIAQRLDAVLGAELTFVGQASDGSIAAELYTLVGVVDTGEDSLDRGIAFIPLDAAQELLVLEGAVHRIVGMVGNRADLPALASRATLPEPLRLLTWDQLMPELAQTIKADREGLYIFLTVIILVVLLGVANTMMMSVMERTHELGVLTALGTGPLQMISLVLAEIFWLGLLGIGSGVATGCLVNLYFGATGIPTGLEAFNYGGVSLSHVHPMNTLKGSFLFPLYILVSALVAGLFPAVKTALTTPARAMRD